MIEEFVLLVSGDRCKMFQDTWGKKFDSSSLMMTISFQLGDGSNYLVFWNEVVGCQLIQGSVE